MIETEKLTSPIFLHNPKEPHNYNDPKIGRQNYIHAIAYETVQYKKCVAEVIKELINQYKNEYEIEDDVEDDWVINVQDLKDVIGELEKCLNFVL